MRYSLKAMNAIRLWVLFTLLFLTGTTTTLNAQCSAEENDLTNPSQNIVVGGSFSPFSVVQSGVNFHSGGCSTPVLFDASNSQVTVRFRGVHTYISDLRQWYLLVNGTPVLLYRNDSNSNSSDNFGNSGTGCFLEFTSNPANSAIWDFTGGPNVCGVFAASHNGANIQTDVRNALDGLDIANASFDVRIFDCTGADVGALHDAQVEFDINGTPYTYTLNGNSVINDGACSHSTAATLSIPLNFNVHTNWYDVATGGTAIGTNTNAFTPNSTLASTVGAGTVYYNAECFDNDGLSYIACPATATRKQANYNVYGLPAVSNVVVTNDCNGVLKRIEVTASLDANNPGGTALEYALNGSGPWQSSNVFTGNPIAGSPTHVFVRSVSAANAVPAILPASSIITQVALTTPVIEPDTEAPMVNCQNFSVTLDGTGNASITAANINNGSTDNCGIASMSVVPSSFSCNDIGNNTVTLTVTDNSGNSSTCTAVVSVTDTQAAPDAGANGTLTICEGTTVTDAMLFAQLGGTPDAGGTWSPVVAGAGTYTYTVSATSACNSDASAIVVVSEEDLPNAGSNGTLMICAGTTVIEAMLFTQLGGAPDVGGVWSPALAGAGTYTYTVLATSPCAADASATVTVTEQVQPNAGTNGVLTICEGVSPTEAQLFASLGGAPDVGGLWTQVGLVYTYTVSAISPCTVDAMATVTVTEQALPNAGIDGVLTICEGTTVTEAMLFAELGGTPSAGGSWAPALSGAGTYTYTVLATSPCAIDATATVTVTEQGAPNAGSNGVLTICEGDLLTTSMLFDQLGGVPDLGGIWSPTLAGAGTYTYTVSATSPCAVDATATVTVTEQVQPNAGTDNTLIICEGTTVTEAILFAQLGGIPDAGGVWSPTLAGAGTYAYTVAATAPCAIDAVATIVVTEQTQPDAGVDGTMVICEGDALTIPQLFASLGGTPDVGGVWSPALAGAGVYTYTVDATVPCTGSSSATVTVTEQVQPNAGTDNTLVVCEGTTLTEAMLFAQLGGTPDAGGVWSPALSGAGTYAYTVAATTPCAIDAVATIVVTEQMQPDAGVDGTLHICEGDVLTESMLFAALGGSPDLGGDWSPMLAGAGTYTYTVNATSPCVSNASATIVVAEVEQSNAGTDGSLVLCEDETLTESMLFTSLGGSPDSGGTWSPAITGAGVYFYTVLATSPCGTDATATVFVMEQELPNAGINGELVICEGDTVTEDQLFVALNGTPDYEGTWSPTLAGAGTYTYTVLATSPCTVDATAEVVVEEQSLPDPGLDGELTVCFGEIVTESLLFSALGGTPDYGGLWVETTEDNFIYMLDAMEPCMADTSAFIEVTYCSITIPEAFTPDGDMINDYFVIEGIEHFPGNEIAVFNRWGKKVFEAKDYDNTWDGGALPTGTYFYVLDVKDENQGEEGKFQGYVYLSK